MPKQYVTKSWKSMVANIVATILQNVSTNYWDARYLSVVFTGKKTFDWYIDDGSDDSHADLVLDLKIPTLNWQNEISKRNVADTESLLLIEVERALLQAFRHQYDCLHLKSRYEILKHCRNQLVKPSETILDSKPDVFVATDNKCITTILEALKTVGNYECTLEIKWKGGS